MNSVERLDKSPDFSDFTGVSVTEYGAVVLRIRLGNDVSNRFQDFFHKRKCGNHVNSSEVYRLACSGLRLSWDWSHAADQSSG